MKNNKRKKPGLFMDPDASVSWLMITLSIIFLGLMFAIMFGTPIQ